MTCNEISKMLDDFVDGALSAEDAARVRAHADACVECGMELAALKSLRAETSVLPREIEPDGDLWREIESVIGESGMREIESGRARVTVWRFGWMVASRLDTRGRKATFALSAGLVAAAVALVVVGAREWRSRTASEGWDVTRIAGAPVIETRDIAESAKLRQGEWLRTDAESSARVDVANIGHVTVGPASAVRLKGSSEKEHRIELARGEVEAFIWAPPRLFFVETPSGVAEDLGCRYNLAVDEQGNGELAVTLGFVSFERDGREVIVPAGARCELRAGSGPGTPHEVGARTELRDALARLDLGGSSPEIVGAVLEASTPDDGVTLWHLIPRVDGAERERIVDTLATWVPFPEQATRAGVMELDARMLERWWDAMYPSWSHWN